MTATTMDRPTESGGAAASPAPQPTLVLSRGDLFSDKRPVRTSEVSIEGWGTVRVASMMAGQHEEITARHEKDGVLLATVAYMAEVVAACLVNPEGERMFADLEDGARQVRNLDLPVVLDLFRAATHRSAMTLEAKEALGKGSAPIPDGGG